MDWIEARHVPETCTGKRLAGHFQSFRPSDTYRAHRSHAGTLVGQPKYESASADFHV